MKSITLQSVCNDGNKFASRWGTGPRYKMNWGSADVIERFLTDIKPSLKWRAFFLQETLRFNMVYLNPSTYITLISWSTVSCWFDIMICNKALKKCALLCLIPLPMGCMLMSVCFGFFFFQQEMKDVFKSQCHKRNG